MVLDVAAHLPPATVASVQERGRQLDVWEAAANLLAELKNGSVARNREAR